MADRDRHNDKEIGRDKRRYTRCEGGLINKVKKENNPISTLEKEKDILIAKYDIMITNANTKDGADKCCDYLTEIEKCYNRAIAYYTKLFGNV